MFPLDLGRALAHFSGLPPLAWAAGAATVCGMLVRLGVRAWRAVRLRRSGILAIDRMDGHEFEERLERLFRRLGYRVETTPTSGDYGADLVVTGAEETMVVQAKRSRGAVGVRAVQEAVAARGYYGCDRA